MTHEAGCCACSQTPNRIGLERTRFTHLSPAPNRSDTPAPRLRHQLRHIWRPPRRCSAATERPASSTRVRELGRPVVRSVRTAGFLPPATPCCRSTAAAGCPAPCPAPCRHARGQEAAREGGARCPQASPGGWVMPAEMQVQAGRQFAVRHAAPPAPTNLSYSPSAHRALPVSRLPACSARRRRRERTRRLLTRHCSRRSECFTTRAGPTPTRATRPRRRRRKTAGRPASTGCGSAASATQWGTTADPPLLAWVPKPGGGLAASAAAPAAVPNCCPPAIHLLQHALNTFTQ